MSRLTELLEEAAGPIVPQFGVGDLRVRARRLQRRRRARRALSTVAVGVALLGLAIVTAGHAARVRHVIAPAHPTTPPAPGGVFPGGTGTVLVLDDGYDGVVVVDLDHRVAVRRPVQGQGAGDQPYRLTLVGSSLIVGWGDVYAAPLDAGSSILLGHATMSIPAVEPGRVWLVDYPGGRIGQGTPTLREVDLSGQVVIQATGLDPLTYYPAIGIPGGVAYETGTGIALWDASTGRITARLGGQQAFVADSHGKLLAWCEGKCTTMHISRLDGADLTVPAPPTASAFEFRDARFSPDGRFLAAVIGGTGPAGTTSSDGSIDVIDTTTGTSRLIATKMLAAPIALEWTPDGRRLFFNENNDQSNETVIGEYLLDTHAVHQTILPFGGAFSGIAIDEHQARSLLRAPVGAPDACPSPTVEPSGRTNACAFRF